MGYRDEAKLCAHGSFNQQFLTAAKACHYRCSPQLPSDPETGTLRVALRLQVMFPTNTTTRGVANMSVHKKLGLLLLALMYLIPAAAFAAVKMPPIQQKPFSTTHIVLQISDASPVTQNLILNVAGNLMTYYGPDKLDLEIVALGPGLKLLLANNVNAPRIHNLAKSYDVKFDACENTLHAFTKKLGHVPKLNSESVLVPAGATRIVDLVQHGYILIRP